ncbi:MAG: YeeE/YedE thiosulfate transporter family protein [Candidatus Eisenbacteria bacterium]
MSFQLVTKERETPAVSARREPAPYLDPYVAGIGLGLVLLAAFVIMGRGLGASGAVSAFVAWILGGVAPKWAHSNDYIAGYLGDGTTHPLKAWLVFEVLGVFVGAFVSAALAGRLSRSVERGPRASVAARLVGAAAGGALMAVGADFGRGCTSGQALTGGSLLNLGSWIFMMCVFGGAYAVARLLRWQWR